MRPKVTQHAPFPLGYRIQIECSTFISRLECTCTKRSFFFISQNFHFQMEMKWLSISIVYNFRSIASKLCPSIWIRIFSQSLINYSLNIITFEDGQLISRTAFGD